MSPGESASPSGPESVGRWRHLIATHFPVQASGDFWSFNRARPKALPAQGWKIHVSATLATAPDIMAAVARIVDGQGILAKTLRDPRELPNLNAGMLYGYAQIGKFITVYPANDEECVRIAHQIARATRHLAGPRIPFERQVMPESPVFVRYGLFTDKSGNGDAGLRAPDGSLEADRRDGNPSWAKPPAGLFIDSAEHAPSGPLGNRYVAYEALIQRGKGGVYRALDLAEGLRKCVIKEGRPHGEVDLSGADAYARIVDEHETLKLLRARGIDVPRIHDFFEQDRHRYLILEYIKGRPLSEVIKNELGVPGAERLAMRLAIQASRLLAQIHAATFVWRDLKAANLILTDESELRPIDFEGSMPNGTRIRAHWGSPGYLPKEWATAEFATFAHDLYALGVLIRQLHAPRVTVDQATATDLPDAPQHVRDILAQLASEDPGARPSAAAVADALSSGAFL